MACLSELDIKGGSKGIWGIIVINNTDFILLPIHAFSPASLPGIYPGFRSRGVFAKPRGVSPITTVNSRGGS